MGFDYQQPGLSDSIDDLTSPSSTMHGNEECHFGNSSPRRSGCDAVFCWTSRLLALIWLLVVFAAACVIILVSLKDNLDSGILLAEDPTRNIPHFPFLLQDLKLGHDFTVDPNNATDEEMKKIQDRWTALLPVGQGFYVPKNRLDELPEPSTDPEGHPAHPVAVFHELHCLYMIMSNYNSLARGGKADHAHLRHCFEYLRLTLMCHADTTIEGKNDVVVLDAEDIQPGYRFGRHVCKDYAAVVSWAADHRTNEYHGIVNADRGHHHG